MSSNTREELRQRIERLSREKHWATERGDWRTVNQFIIKLERLKKRLRHLEAA